VKQILANQANVLHALILRAIQTRFGGKHVNFLIALCWPLGHILLLLAIYSLMGRAAPIGASTVMFFATGLTPYMFFNYPSRFMMMGALMNKPLLSFPVVKLTDLIIASAILETVAGFAVITVTASVLYCIGEHVWPQDPGMALCALGGMWVFAMGYGLFCSVLAMVNSVLPIATALIQIVFYLTSGILFIPAALPERAQ
jgi:capsular polysaccharide transport system permease protein